MTARFVRTQKEMEGRYEDVWALVDETDDVESWTPDAELTLVGQPAPRHDGHARAAGRVRYTVDVRLAGMLHAAVLRSPVAHGRVRSLDLDAALAVPGVRAVIGPESELSLTTRAPLLAAEPGYAGQPIAVVAADTLEAAQAGSARSGARHRGARARRRPAGGPQRAALHGRPDRRCQGRRRGGPRRRRRDHRARHRDAGPAADAARAARRRRLVGRRPAHRLGLDAGHVLGREELAAAFGLRKDDVRVLAEFVGGGFGAKQGAGFEALAAAELARITGRPVRLVNDRHAEQLDGGRRGATRQTVRLGAPRDGTLTAIEADAVVGWVRAAG